MALKDILPSKKEEQQEYYWALSIEPGWVQAGVWRIEGEKTQVISTSPPTPWELDEELIAAVDTSLSAAVQDFPEEVKEPSKTVFGVMSSWVSEGQIKENHLEVIKNICSELSLNPVGFVILPEAIAHYSKSEEGSPLSAVVLGISKENIEITVYKLGKQIGSAQVARSLSLVEDVVEGLTRFAQNEALPSRFILYNGKEGEIEEARQTLLKANWDDLVGIKFLHTPKIETITSNNKVHAVMLAGASEIASVTSLHILKEEEEKDEVVKSDIEEKEVEGKIITPKDLGFELGTDVAVKTEKPFPSEIEEEDSKKETKEEGEITLPLVEKIKPDSKKDETKGQTKRKLFNKIPTNVIMNLKDKLESIRNRFGKKKTEAKYGKRAFLFGGVFLLALLVIGFASWWFYPKATVIVYVSPKKLDEKINILVDPGIESADIEAGILPGEVLEETFDGDKTKSTTGAKTVGEQATGEVTLYRVGPELSLVAGTKIYGPGSLEFSLDEQVAVASGSAGSPSSTKAKVKAVDIGAEYNLAANTLFTVANYSTSDIEAKNESAFSGGSSREISAVSEEDQEILEEDLTGELESNAKDKFKENLTDDKFFIDESLSSEVESRDFSNKVGDEASTLKLSLSLNVIALVVDKSSLNSLAEEVLKDRIPDGFVLRDDQIEVDFSYEDNEDGKYRLSAFVEANLLPEINPEEVGGKILGKYPPLVENYFIEEIPGFVRAEMSFNKPRFPGRLGTLPHIKNNLEVIISAEK